jgi:hypothetical protein
LLHTLSFLIWTCSLMKITSFCWSGLVWLLPVLYALAYALHFGIVWLQFKWQMTCLLNSQCSGQITFCVSTVRLSVSKVAIRVPTCGRDKSLFQWLFVYLPFFCFVVQWGYRWVFVYPCGRTNNVLCSVGGKKMFSLTPLAVKMCTHRF